MFWIHLDIGQVAQIIWTYVISVMSNKSFSRFPCWIMDMKTLERFVLKNRIIDFPKRLCARFFYPRQLTCFCVFLNLKTLHCLTACSGGGGCGNPQQTKFFAHPRSLFYPAKWSFVVSRQKEPKKMQNFGDDDNEVWFQSILSPMPLPSRPLPGCHTAPLFAHQEIFIP